MRKLFVNRAGQLRSGWKIILVFVLYYILGLVFTLLGFANFAIYFIITKYRYVAGPDLFAKLYSEIVSNPMFNFVSLVLVSLSMIVAIIFALKVIEKKKLRDIGLTRFSEHKSDFIFGLILGAVSITVIFIILVLTGNVTLKNSILRPDFSPSVLMGLLIFILVGINEEMFARGYCMMVLKQTGSKWAPLIVSSVIFSLMHGLNPNVSIVGILNIFLVGILFGFMLVKTENLWMPIGYHITWNFFQGSVFSFPVSGMPLKGIYEIDIVNYNLLNGGRFGPEGGILATVAILIGLYIVSRYKGMGGKYQRFDIGEKSFRL